MSTEAVTGSFPSSISEINRLETDEKEEIYRTLIPEKLLDRFSIDRETLTVDGEQVVQFRSPAGSRTLELSIKQHIADQDPILYLHVADSFNNQILVLLVVINNPHAPRFNTDIDQNANRTVLGTVSRNIPAEIAAMKAGLAPGQVRAGLRIFKSLVPAFEAFITRMGHDIFFIEPLAYHNAIVFERYGFNYLRGLNDMHMIHKGFQPGNELHNRLTADNPFRQPEAWKTVRGRAWAIHDGILGHPYTGFQMYKRVGQHASINTFPDYEW